MEEPRGAESLRNPETYLHAALRAFVSSAHERVNSLLKTPNVFNYGPGMRYPNLTALHDELKKAVDYWQSRNAFVADLLRATLRNSAQKHSDRTSDDVIIGEIFLPLTNYFFSYIKVDRRGKPVPTVRVLFPVDSDCEQCPLGPDGSKQCANSCFRFAFFPHKPPEMLDRKYNGHYEAAQFALADASFAAATPDLTQGSMAEISFAALMVPLLLGRPLLFTDAGAKEEFDVPINTIGGNRVLEVRWRFPKMNGDLGIRAEAFLPIQVPRSFMPGFYGGLGGSQQSDDAAPQMWVPEFPNSCPFCIELYSPMRDWFAHASDETDSNPAKGQRYIFQDSASVVAVSRDKPPIPRIALPVNCAGEDDQPTPKWNDIAKVLALGFNLQHYSELMASAFVDWLRDMLTISAYDPFAPTLKRRYSEHLGLDKSQPLPPELEQFFKFVSDTPDLLADVLNEIHHGMLLQPNFAATDIYELAFVEGIGRLARDVDAATKVELLAYGPSTPYCEKPFSMENLSDVLRVSDPSSVLPRLVAEIIRNHKRERQESSLRFHSCLDPDQKRFSLHFCSPDVNVDLRTYLNLRQGLPHLRQGVAKQDNRTRQGIGLALSRVIAEEHGFEYVLGLGRDTRSSDERNKAYSTAALPLDVNEYRKDLHTRIYFGGTL